MASKRRPKLADGSISPSDARKAARRALGLIAQGIDPFERLKPISHPVMSDLAVRYWNDHASKQKSARDIRRHLDIYIIPLLGTKVVREVQLADVQMLLDHVARRAKFQGNRTLATLSKMFSLAERWQLRPQSSNVCKLVQRFKERARRRYLRAEEAPRLANALDVEAAHHPLATGALRFSSILGCVVVSSWQQCGTNSMVECCALPDSKNGDQRDVYLSDTALSIIAALPRSGERIFSPLSADELRCCWRRVCKTAGISDLRVHDSCAAPLLVSPCPQALGYPR